ncbi:MAG TPA: SH3 domain-containing protein [Anditalea sp.]|nr:SH3 domain-containing protein [Anditalea sp.]
MQIQNNFIKLTPNEFTQWLSEQSIARTLLSIQQHHTWNPRYLHFTGDNHFDIQLAMRNYHIGVNGWADIGQHFTIFPDGMILTGRSLERVPACIFGHNANSLCIEHLGNFDIGGDVMAAAQRDASIHVTARLCTKFNLPVNPFSIVYHHWFNLANGSRNNGNGNNKTCPGTSFFGGNKVEDCINNFLPLIQNEIDTPTITNRNPSHLLKNVMVIASRLNIRMGPGSRFPIAAEREAASAGAVLRVYRERDGWYKISNSQENWVASRFTREARRATVNASTLNVRIGPGANFPRVDSLVQGEEIFIVETINDWSKIAIEEKWVSTRFLTLA